MLFNKGQAYTLYQWLAALPPEQFRLRPRLSILHAWTLFSQSQFAAAQEPLNAAWEAVQGRQGPEVDRILGEVALAWGVLSQLSLRDTETMRKQALLAWEKLPPDDQMLRGIAAWLLGSSYYWDGDMIHGEEYFRRATHLCQQAGNIYFTLVSIVDLATTIREQGRFREAYQLLLQTEQEMTSGGRQPHPILGQLYIFSGQFLLQWNELEAAEQHLMRGIDLVSRDIPGEILFFGMSTLPYLKLAQGDREEAVRLALDCIERVQSYPLPYVPPLIRSNLVRFWMRVGDRRRVEEWVSTCGRTSEDTILYPYESQYTTLAKVMIWQGRGKEGLKLLAKLAPPEQLAYRKGKIFYIWALQAMALRQSNDLDGALIMLKNSLSLAQPEGYIRPYVDEGQPMEDLLARGTAQGIWRQASLDGYVDSLMTAFEKERTQSAAALEVAQGIPPFQPQPGRTDGMELVETLSERELDVLRLACTRAF